MIYATSRGEGFFMYPVPASCNRRLLYYDFCRFLVLAGLLLALTFNTISTRLAIPQFLENILKNGISFYSRDPVAILKSAMPVLAWSGSEGDNPYLTPSQLFLVSWSELVRVNLYSPATVLQSQVPFLELVNPVWAMATVSPEGYPPVGEKVITAAPGECLVAIYNTHTGETYALTDGVERLEGKRGGVVTAAAALQEALQSKHGIGVARSDRINDTLYRSSYIESEKTARALLAANPGVKVVLDIHRDSGKSRGQSVTKINGQEVARVLIVVGSDARRPFPNWRQNHAFAKELATLMNELYPGLCLGIRVKDGIYNQYLHPHALLLEVGSVNNSTEEAVRSAYLLADVLARLIK